MASFHKRSSNHGQIRWQVRVRRPGYQTRSQTFTDKKAGLQWARDIEARMDRGEPLDEQEAQGSEYTVRDLIKWYLAHKTPNKPGDSHAQAAERGHLQALLHHPLADRKVRTLDTADYARYRDDRLQKVQPTTVRREFAVIRHMHKVGEQECRAVGRHGNPAQGIEIKGNSGERDRRLWEGEEPLLLEASDMARTPWPKALLVLTLAVPTRRSDLLRLRWSQVDLDHERRVGEAFVPVSKNGESRWIPLPQEAYELLTTLPRLPDDDRVIPLSMEATKSAWRGMLNRARKLARERGRPELFDDLRFHDLKHEATSRLVERRVADNDIELSFMAGQKDPRMLRRYTNLRAKNMAERMSQSTEPPSST